MSYPGAQKLADHLKIAKAKEQVRVIDLAAGSGIWGIAVAQKSPQVRVDGGRLGGDDPTTKRITEKFGVRDRFDFIEGDLFRSELWQRLRSRDAGAYSAQRRRTT
jgi:Predicted O-methyltransferase